MGSVTLLTMTPDAENLIEHSGRVCYDSQDKVGSDPERIQKWIRAGHESVIEHASATFKIVASRVLTHQLIRHRLASYSQKSQRYVSEDEPSFIIPSEIQDVDGREMFKLAMDYAWDTYRYLLSRGYDKQIARYVLPGACLTTIICTWNFREIRHIIKLRASSRALPEMQDVAGQIRDIMIKLAPNVFGDLK